MTKKKTLDSKFIENQLDQTQKRFKELTKDELIREMFGMKEEKKYSSFAVIMSFVIGYFVCFISIMLAKELLIKGGL